MLRQGHKAECCESAGTKVPCCAGAWSAYERSPYIPNRLQHKVSVVPHFYSDSPSIRQIHDIRGAHLGECLGCRFFTAVCIYQLQEKGLLNVTDAVRSC